MKMTLEQCIIAAGNAVGEEQKRVLFKHKRSGEELTKEQVRAIKLGRKLLRKDMKKQGLKDKQDFEVTAASMGLYFDNNNALLLLLFRGCAPWALLGALLLSIGTMTLVSSVTEMRGHFTISLDEEAFREGFVLSETADFRNATTYLFATPAEDVPCISISDIPLDVDNHEGQHNADYFAYTFFLRNEGESTVGYDWELKLNSESKSLSDALWVMLFRDGEMLFYAEPDDYNRVQALPDFDDNTRGYINPEIMGLCARPEEQFQLIAQRGELSYYRLVPINFLDRATVAQGVREGMVPGETHKYTVVIWLEGDDPDCGDHMIGGHAGMEFNIELIPPETQPTGK